MAKALDAATPIKSLVLPICSEFLEILRAILRFASRKQKFSAEKARKQCYNLARLFWEFNVLFMKREAHTVCNKMITYLFPKHLSRYR